MNPARKTWVLCTSLGAYEGVSDGQVVSCHSAANAAVSAVLNYDFGHEEAGFIAVSMTKTKPKIHQYVSFGVEIRQLTPSEEALVLQLRLGPPRP